MCGINCNIENDEEILKINSPKTSCDGPYIVVYKCVRKRWAIVALCWDGVPVLAIRWFYGGKGSPVSTGHPTWFIIPDMLYQAILNGIPLEYRIRDDIDRFLAGEIDGEELKERWENNLKR